MNGFTCSHDGKRVMFHFFFNRVAHLLLIFQFRSS